MSRKKLLIILVVVLFLALIAGGGYYYFQYQKSQELLKNPSRAAQQEQASLIEKVGKLIDLPQDNQITVATVSDVSKLKGQEFFARAKNGYKVLIYPKAKKAILYDPIANKIIEVGPVNLGQTADARPEVSGASSSAQVSVALYNGTPTQGLTTTIEKQLAKQVPNITVVQKANAAKTTYERTLIIDLTGKQSVIAKQLAQLLKGSVGPLPTDEAKPSGVDILVILGK